MTPVSWTQRCLFKKSYRHNTMQRSSVASRPSCSFLLHIRSQYCSAEWQIRFRNTYALTLQMNLADTNKLYGITSKLNEKGVYRVWDQRRTLFSRYQFALKWIFRFLIHFVISKLGALGSTRVLIRFGLYSPSVI